MWFQHPTSGQIFEATNENEINIHRKGGCTEVPAPAEAEGAVDSEPAKGKGAKS